MGKAGITIFGLLAALAAILWACVALLDYGGDARETKIRLEIANARAAALESAQKGTIDAIQNLQTVEDEIRRAARADDRPVGPVLRDQLERMRSSSDRAHGPENPPSVHP